MGKLQEAHARTRRNNMRSIIIPAAIFALLLLLPGCLLQKEYFKEAVRGEPVYISLGLSGSCPTGDCICMTCNIDLPKDPYDKFFPVSYASRLCKFSECGPEQYANYIQAPVKGQDRINFFMIGQGGFGEFNKANPYCNNSLRMPVKWLDSRDGLGEYPLPDVGRATCFMEKSSIPVYILYSRGESVSAERAGKIASLFLDRGPVIITSEFEFNSSNPEIAANVTAQVRAMKQACPNCLIALAPSLWDDSEAFQKVASDSGSSVDLFAFGLNSHDFITCNPAKMYYAGMSYSQYLLFKYKKPSLWAYLLFDRDYSADGSCMWDDEALAHAYSSFYTYAPGMAASGVIGAAPYSLYGVGPLYCRNCSLFGPSGSPILPMQAAWFANCQEAYATRSLLPLAFSNAPGTTCLFGPRIYSYTGYSYYTERPGAQKQPAGNTSTFYSCDACLVTNIPASLKLSPIKPSGSQACEAYPILDAYADIRDIDPALVRATVQRESGFDPCATSSDSATCGKTPGMRSVADPDSSCTPYTAPSGRYVCAMGLMQTLAPPYTYWDEIDFAHEGQMEEAKYCAEGEKFNPYNPGHSACIGTAELADAVRAAKSRIEPIEGKVLAGYSRGSDDYNNMKGILTVMLARLYYAGPALVTPGNVNKWANDFEDFRNADSICRNNPGSHPCCSGSRVDPILSAAGCCGSGADFVNYVTNEKCYEIRPKNSNEGGKNKDYITNTNSFVRLYLGIREKCGICDSNRWEQNIEDWYASTEHLPMYG